MNKIGINKKIIFTLLLSTILILPHKANAISPTLNKLLVNIDVALKSAGAVLSAIGFVIASYLWLTSGGSTEKTGLARKAFIAAVIGTVILVVASVSGQFLTMIREVLGV